MKMLTFISTNQLEWRSTVNQSNTSALYCRIQKGKNKTFDRSFLFFGLKNGNWSAIFEKFDFSLFMRTFHPVL